MTLDPALGLVARWLLAFVFVLGLVHKLRSPSAFSAALANYRLLPAALSTPAAGLLIVLEVAATAGLIGMPQAGAALSVALLLLYTGAIAINLARGRRDIDCGCSGPLLRQTLTGWLVLRNAALIALGALAFAPAGLRPLTFLDLVTVVAALLVFALIYSSANRLTVIAARFTTT